MCGFVGLVQSSLLCDGHLRSAVAHAALSIAHRGPDGADAWSDETAGIALAHRRLAIVDLSDAGRQPMHSSDGRWVIAFNGEVYNHQDLRHGLNQAGAAPVWRGHSDTETLLAGVSHWGIEETLKRSVGMFALALWDRQTRTLHLARDRFGEKPLYYGWTGIGRSQFVFGSELKALRALPGFDNALNRQALALYLRFNQVPAPHSIHQGIFKLEPGCLLSINAASHQPHSDPPRPGQLSRASGVELRRWWSMAELVTQASQHPFKHEVEAVEALEHVLQRAVREQAQADVPLGAFLSGGVDSSVVVALMQRQATRGVRTFTVGFDEVGFDESAHAAAVARHLGTEHTELRVRADEALKLIPSLPQMYDEPFADSSQIPTHLVCKAARAHVTVALSGDAGDEMFGGYNRYVWGPGLWRRFGHWPQPLRQALSRGLNSAPMRCLERLGRPLGVLHLSEKIQKVGRALDGADTLDKLYVNLVSEWSASNLVLQSDAFTAPPRWQTVLDDPMPAALGDDLSLLMYMDTLFYMSDDILCKVDRAAMAASLETRAPFLDHRVAEVAWRLPAHMRVRAGQGKWALRQLLYRHVPPSLIERPKAGFRLPVGQWLRGPLRDWAEALLAPERLRREGLLNPTPITKCWHEHLRGRADHTAALWGVLMFQCWLEVQ
jgi:asparagine synthase (glutamine-hydrolysing)